MYREVNIDQNETSMFVARPDSSNENEHTLSIWAKPNNVQKIDQLYFEQDQQQQECDTVQQNWPPSYSHII